MDIIKLLDWQDQQDFYVMVLEHFSHCMNVFDTAAAALRRRMCGTSFGQHFHFHFATYKAFQYAY